MKLTNEQINEMMTACVIGIAAGDYEKGQTGAFMYSRLECGSMLATEVKNYCNDPAVMMPIALEAGISIIKHKDYRMFTAFISAELDDMDNDLWVMLDCRHDDTKPCRAAAIVYLKSKGVL